MTFWERSNDLGKLEILEVYEYYDQPMLLACRSASGSLYLVVAVDADNSAEHWICVAVSRLRFEAIRSGGVDLNTAFNGPEDDRIFHFTVPRDLNAPVVLQNVSPSELPSDWFPALGATIALPTSTLPTLTHDISGEAQQVRRDVLSIKFNVDGAMRNEAPANLIGRALEAIQDTITSLAQILPHNLHDDMVRSSELVLTAVGGGSFEVRLASARFVDLFNRTGVTGAAEELCKLMLLSEDSIALRNRLTALDSQVIDKYLSFLRSIENRVTDATVEWASAEPGKNSRAVMRYEQIKASIDVMTSLREPEHRFDVSGHLNGGSIDKKNYEFVLDEPYEGVAKFAGKVLEEAVSSINGATLGGHYTATFEEHRSTKENGKVDVKYALARLQRLD